MIIIHWDFTDGTELSYLEGLSKGDGFTTCCLDFFNMDVETDDVVVVNKSGRKVSRKNISDHTSKEIRKSHNIQKMLVSGSFEWL